ncbi:muscle M-line assembly protein unc-89-like isoform X2 [Belonocnema kinseyi]|uniref:muscle M-line assembly protein unc-89-like isoform X2 n=1 Tax=Belonocnema kinseyi TaxID=2817044 RepID=UPI00143D7E88|nr:muscle M-line assembly protein unc-89-like isoform X2 [Belonocnema kinseyi]
MDVIHDESQEASGQKLTGIEKAKSTLLKKEFKSKLPAPKVITRPSSTTKQLKKPAVSGKVAKEQIPKMQSEVEETTTKSKTPKEDLKSKTKASEPEVVDLEIAESHQDEKSSVANGQEDSLNEKSSENGVTQEEKNEENGEPEKIENGDSNVTPEEPSQNGNHEEEDIQIVAEEAPKDANSDEKLDKEDQQSESQTDTESYVVESTTSEVSESSEQPSEPKEQEQSPEAAILDAPCVSYDSSITLKKAQIKLNDCVKDSSKPGEENNEPVNELYKDLSFGKTLRTISGRRSLGRLRHVTFREHNRISPNSSLFVNTSSTSQDDDFKVLRHRSGLSDSVSSNGTSSERKRKLYPQESNILKKQKTESEGSFLNASYELLKSFRRPSLASTPFNFQTDKLNLSGKKISKDIKADETPDNKWCAIM